MKTYTAFRRIAKAQIAEAVTEVVEHKPPIRGRPRNAQRPGTTASRCCGIAEALPP
jgi:hypothetical protein